jgi:hypothetical protein
MRVFAAAGLMQFTAILLRSVSFPNDFVNAMAPAFAAL